ncbi:MAG: helix-turn-helix domain-containing protein [Deltaproteobacteria bacterium]|nr:helix-turn-helix domain-containing protein [Deltaproteobacteria bacterium]
MTERPATLESALKELLRQVVREEIQAATGQNGQNKELLTPDELAERLKVPLSWVYEQSRQGNIPTHRIGRYIRFDARNIRKSEKKELGPLTNLL